MTESLHYTAFLSYAHKDEKWAEWLHTKLEQFKIDKDLVGINTTRGPVPANLRPIFLDRGNFAGGDTLHEATIMAIDGSRALIVLCSTTAAGRPAVNEEVRMFKARHPDRPIIPVLIEGTAPDNFPRALLYELNEDGSVSDRSVTVLGPDLRESADGKQLGLAKIVAGMLGFSNADDIYRRAERHRLRQSRIRSALTVAAVVTVALGGYFGWANLQSKLVIKSVANNLRSHIDVPVGQGADPGANHLNDMITQIAEGTATDPRRTKALRLLSQNKTVEAADLLEQIAKDLAARIERRNFKAAEAYRHLGAISGLADPERGLKAYSVALKYNQDDLDSLYGHGRLNLQASNLSGARTDLERLRALAKSANSPKHLYLAHIRLGEVAKTQGLLAEARGHQDLALGIAGNQVSTTDNDPQWMRYRSFSLEKIGDLLLEQGKLVEAFDNFRISLSIRQTLHTKQREDKSKQRELAVAMEKAGDVHRLLAEYDRAAERFKEAFALRQALVKAEPDKPGWKRALSLSHERFGQLHLSQKNTEGALKSFGEALAIRKSLADSDPDYATWQRDLSVSHEQLGDVYFGLNDPDGSLEAYEKSLAIRQNLAEKDPNNAVWKRDLSLAHVRVGKVLTALGEDETGLPHLQSALKLAEELARPKNGALVSARARIELARSYAVLGLFHSERQENAPALVFFRKAKEIAEPIAKQAKRADWMHIVTELDKNIAMVEE